MPTPRAQPGRQSLPLLVFFGFFLFQTDPIFIAQYIPSYYTIRYLALATLMIIPVILWPRSTGLAIRATQWGPWLILFSIYQITSSFWSAAPFDGLFFGLCFLSATMSIFALASQLTPRTIVQCFILATLATAILGAAFAVAVPEIGQEQKFLLLGDWRGLTNQKNLYGYFNAFAAALLLLRMMSNRYSTIIPFGRFHAFILLFVFLSCALMSGSRGAQAIALIIVFVAMILSVPIRRHQWLMICASIALLITIIVLNFTTISDGDLALFNIPVNTSNRTTLWFFGMNEASGNILFGVGRSGFWVETRIEQFMQQNNWVLENFHNAYVTLLVEGGLIGLLLFVAVLLLTLLHLAKAYVSDGRADIRVSLAMLLSFIFYCAVEAVVGRTTTMSFYITFVFIVSSQIADKKQGHSDEQQLRQTLKRQASQLLT